MTASARSFDGKIAIVTGAAGGIGRASARAFGAKGAHVLVADIDDEHGHETVSLITSAGDSAQFVHADVAQSSDVIALVDTALRDHGRLDFAHNKRWCCRRQPADRRSARSRMGSRDECHPARRLPLHEVRDRADARVRSRRHRQHRLRRRPRRLRQPICLRCVKARRMVSPKSGALEYGARGIRINAVCPGTVWSPMVDNAVAAFPDLQGQLEAMHPIGRLGTADEIAAAVVWLCSDDASFVLGHALSVDGGYVVP